MVPKLENVTHSPYSYGDRSRNTTGNIKKFIPNFKKYAK